MHYRPELDGLRAVAVLGVIFFHLGLEEFSGGFTGVDVFFTLSGFLITYIIVDQKKKGTFSFSGFYIRRARRLLPALLVMIAASYLGAFLLLGPDHFAAFAQSSIYASLSISNIGFFLESGYFDSSKFAKPLLHTWSLGVEEQFYLVWPLIMTGLIAIARKTISQVIFMSALVLVGFLVSLYVLEISESAAFFLSPFRAWQFGIGGCLALLWGSWAQAVNGWRYGVYLMSLLTLSGTALLVYGFFYVTESRYPGFQALIPTFGCLMMIAGASNKVSDSLLANPVFIFLGKISYSLYLWHWPIIIYIRSYTGGALSVDLMILASVLSLFCACLSYYYIESPLRTAWTADEKRERLAVPLGMVTAVLAIALLGSHVWAQGGWPDRLAADARAQLTNLKKGSKVKCRNKKIEGLGRKCVFGHKKNLDLVLIGDSHADALSHGLDKVLAKKKVAAVRLTRPGTLPLVGAVTFDDEVPKKADFQREFDFIRTNDLDYVIVHSRFALHWSTYRTRSESRKDRKWVGLSSSQRPDSIEASQENFRVALDLTMKELSELDKKVLFIGALPNQGVDLASCLLRPSFILSVPHLVETCQGLTRSEALTRNAKINGQLQQSANKYGLFFLDPTDLFCPKNQDQCLRQKDGRLLYSDDNHLSPYGAALLATEIEDVLF